MTYSSFISALPHPLQRRPFRKKREKNTKIYALPIAAAAAAVFITPSSGITIRIASSLTLAGPLSCPLGTPGTLFTFPIFAPPGPKFFFIRAEG